MDGFFVSKVQKMSNLNPSAESSEFGGTVEKGMTEEESAEEDDQQILTEDDTSIENEVSKKGVTENGKLKSPGTTNQKKESPGTVKKRKKGTGLRSEYMNFPAFFSHLNGQTHLEQNQEQKKKYPKLKHPPREEISKAREEKRRAVRERKSSSDKE